MKIILVDNQLPFRETIKNLLLTQFDFDLVGVGKDGYDAMRLMDKVEPDVVILDIETPLLDGLKAAASIRLRHSSASVIVLAKDMDDKAIINAVCCGVKGFLLRASVLEEVTKAIRNVYLGHFYMSRAVASRTFDLFSEIVKTGTQRQQAGSGNGAGKSLPPQITRTESKIAAFIGEGLSNKRIAEILRLKEGTVRNYISVILQKTHLEHRTQIAIYALNNGFYGKNAETAAVNSYSGNNIENTLKKPPQLKFNFKTV
ncbi:MAG: response regulator transcription factor [Spirochaetaceae bacterium]|nr:response regulator transcription factor [Spirochaetaceae bacterium]